MRTCKRFASTPHSSVPAQQELSHGYHGLKDPIGWAAMGHAPREGWEGPERLTLCPSWGIMWLGGGGHARRVPLGLNLCTPTATALSDPNGPLLMQPSGRRIGTRQILIHVLGSQVLAQHWDQALLCAQIHWQDQDPWDRDPSLQLVKVYLYLLI